MEIVGIVVIYLLIGIVWTWNHAMEVGKPLDYNGKTDYVVLILSVGLWPIWWGIYLAGLIEGFIECMKERNNKGS